MENTNLKYDIPVRYFDIDANHHVNNSVYFTYMEEARTHLLMEPFLEVSKKGINFVVTETNCKYKRPITLLDKVSVKLSVVNIKGVSFEISYEFVDPAGQLYAEGYTRMACVEKETQKLVR